MEEVEKFLSRARLNYETHCKSDNVDPKTFYAPAFDGAYTLMFLEVCRQALNESPPVPIVGKIESETCFTLRNASNRFMNFEFEEKTPIPPYGLKMIPWKPGEAIRIDLGYKTIKQEEPKKG